MPSEREFLSVERSVEYNIAGNNFRAFFGAGGALLFVLDGVIDAVKPNVLLVLNADGGRKWDDILANDMGVDLETVRPKKDNRYQKLDIEYTGLDVYAALIDAYENDADLTQALDELVAFRRAAARRAASGRLIVAEDAAEKSRDTIDAASETVVELQERMRELRAKLSVQRKSIGREPTKQSAAKILRTEAQIDATGEKLRRAKKRLANAQKRLDDAEEDATAARAILAQLADDADISASNRAVAAPVVTNMVVASDAPVPAEIEQDKLPDVVHPRATELTITNQEQGALTMADEKEEVKPLFDTDPEILDEEIAFKPIDFSAPVVENPAPVPAASVADETENLTFEPIPTPLSFAPPAAVDDMPTQSIVRPIDVRPVVDDTTQPVLDSMTPIVDERAEFVQQTPAPVAAPVEFTPTPAPAAAAPVPDVAPAPVDSSFRPVSPITGAAIPAGGGVVSPVRAQKPTMLYYVMLIVLIVLSIFTLWLYQKNTSDTLPDLSATVAAEEIVVDTDAQSPFLVDDADVVVDAPVAQPVPEPVVQPEPEPVPEPAAVEPEPVPVEIPAVPAEPVPVVVDVPVVEPEPVDVVVEPAPAPVPEPVPAKPIIDEAAIIASKPAYNVSQNENMFVAASDYESDDNAPVAASAPVEEKPVVEYSAPAVVTPAIDEYVPEYESEFVLQEAASEVYPVSATDDDMVESCADGNAPDINGCCTGEVFTDMEDGTFACCTADGLDCFPPMN